MGRLFGFLGNRKKQDVTGVAQISISKQYTAEGVYYRLFRDSNELAFPLNLRVSEYLQLAEIECVEVLEDLWFDGYLEQTSAGYFFDYCNFDKVLEESLRKVGVPAPTAFKLKLAHSSAVGTPHFKLFLEKSHGSWKHLERTAKMEGPWLTLPDQQILLMEKNQYQFQKFIESAPDPMDRESIFAYVAEARSLALQHGYEIDDYLQRQEYLFVDQVEVDLNYDGESITFIPSYASNDNISENLLAEMSRTAQRYAVDSGNRKVFVKPSIADNADRIKRVPSLAGADIPKFAENPEAYLPDVEGLDLSKFGERVKSLGIRVYRAQPFVHASEQERGWFELDFGFNAQDENGEIHETWEASELMGLINEAKESGESFIEWNGNWLRLPQDAEEIVEKSKEAKLQFNAEGLVDVTKLPYVLEIYENIAQLEFNQPILQAQQQMQDSGVLQQIPPASFTALLKPFQAEGFVWMKSLHYRHLGGLLADDMGLGKTIQVISFLTHLHEAGKLTPTLVIVPKTLMDNWEKELSKFAPGLLRSFYLHRGTQRLKDAEELKRIGITVTTYQTLVRDQLIFGQVDWQAVICDEAQAIKNPSTASSKVLKAMKSRFRLAMTGTPVENGLSELWSIMDYVQPGLLGSLSEFKNQFINRIEAQEPEAEQQLLARISTVYKRRTKSEELGDQLPSKTSVMTKVPLGEEQEQLYKEVITLVQQKMMDGLQAIQRLKQLSSHPGLVSEQYLSLPYNRVPKLKETIDIVRRARETGEKVLIFTEYRQMQEILRSTIRECFEIMPGVINGMTDRRQQQVDLFNAKPGFDVLILSPKAAGTGLTITSANHVIHYTRWWNPAVENQATDRAYRIGQDKPVYVYYPVVSDDRGITKNGTVEEIVHRLLTEKQDMASSVIVSSRKLDIESEVLNTF
ncbi:DEAD/DEAH box helicase [Saccharibacillus alkalitolerans]|uniref:DEAD/DEAH box helicase n=1 Tax=Saccharibacillus alkalitolerans TaxID=2705290 RepID=A0ABX0F4F7_9BACL|nr:DEAD/DEAH box helicase [Saccharibacillus alkalitolerans]NGZ74081.1 DEAD/DEAH box helicase [Saccharibacillus alkalitolerans]